MNLWETIFIEHGTILKSENLSLEIINHTLVSGIKKGHWADWDIRHHRIKDIVELIKHAGDAKRYSEGKGCVYPDSFLLHFIAFIRLVEYALSEDR